MIKTIELLVQLKVTYRGKKVSQVFICNPLKENKKYIGDERFNLQYVLNKKIKEFALSTMYPDDYSFIDRIDTKEEITVEFLYKKEGPPQSIFKKSTYFTISATVPTSATCDYCIFKQEEKNGCFFCEKKQINITHKLKNCSVFRQISLFKT